MKILKDEQGSVEWMKSRLGIPTASRFDSIVTPKTMKPAKSDRYLSELLAEWLLGQPLDWGSSAVEERGTDLENEARRWYEMERDVDVIRTGVILRDDGLVGGSPDGLVGADGVLEIKCPMALKHTQHLIFGVDDYRGQTQGLLYLTGRSWCDVLSYHPDLPPVLVRFDRDPDYQKALEPALAAFIEKLDALKETYAAHRITRPWDFEPEGGA